MLNTPAGLVPHVLPLAAPTDLPTCAVDGSTWCGQVWHLTHVSWLAESAAWLVAKPVHIVAIALIAIVTRLFLHRLIRRLTQNRGKIPTILRPLRERAPRTLASLVSERRTQRARTIGSVLESIVTFAVGGLAAVLILGDLGLNLTPIIASAGVIGVAVGFGAQNLVKDFLSGMFMLLEDQYGVGDTVDLGPATGTVETVGLRVTTVRDVAGTVWYVRNGEIARVGNSSQGFAVAVVDVPLGYATDVNRALGLFESLVETATTEPPLNSDMLEPPKVLGVQGMTNEAITLRLTVKVRPGRQWATQRELRRRIMTLFDEAGIERPTGAPQSLTNDPQGNRSPEWVKMGDVDTQENFYRAVGGEDTFRRIVSRFYAEVAKDEILLPLYPEQPDLSGATERLTLFLMQYWGGPHTYSDQRGHPRLRMRHAPFKIGPLERDAWLRCMRIAVDEERLAEPYRSQLWEYLEAAAHSMVNSWM